jgi:hypothetical protein
MTALPFTFNQGLCFKKTLERKWLFDIASWQCLDSGAAG